MESSYCLVVSSFSLVSVEMEHQGESSKPETLASSSNSENKQISPSFCI